LHEIPAAVGTVHGVALSVSAINRYPVKSCRGEGMSHAVVEPWGLSGDRRWMLVDAAGDQVTAREVHRMLLIEPHVTPHGLSIAAPDLPVLNVPFPDGRSRIDCRVHGKPIDGALAGPDAHAWFAKATGVDVRLVYLDDPTQRPTNPAYTDPGDRVSLADGYPLLLTCEASLDALNDFIAERSSGDSAPLPMTRFRPSVVVRNAEAWAEDDWRRIRVGEAEFRVVKGCDRCVLTTIDPWTAQRGAEPIATLARRRAWDGKTWFGVFLVPDTPGVRITLDDVVEALDAAAPGGGPLRSGVTS
jgi:uncharacterized protein YcbX